MSFFSSLFNFSRGADRSGRMMDTLGVDLTGLPDYEIGGTYRQITLRCSKCEQADACENWLEEHGSADRPPSYCRNAALFERLAQAKEKA